MEKQYEHLGASGLQQLASHIKTTYKNAAEAARQSAELASQSAESARQSAESASHTAETASTAISTSAQALQFAKQVLDDANEGKFNGEKGEPGKDGSVLYPSMRVDASGYLVVDIPDESEGTNFEIDEGGFLCVGFPDL